MANQGETNKRSQTSTQSSMRQIGQALSDTATLRSGSITKETLRLYSQRLAACNPEDVLAALGKVAEQKRKESVSSDGLSRWTEPAIPDMGAMLALVEVERIARENRSAAKQSERLVRWLCPDCKNTTTGFPFSGDDLVNRRCKSPYKRVEGKRTSLSAGQICGGRMDVVYDESQPDGVARKVDLPEWMTR